MCCLFPIDQEALQTLCLAWQWRKGLIKSKKAKGRKYCGMNEQDCLEIAMGYLQEDYDIVKEQVYQQLDQFSLGRMHKFNNSTLLKWIKEPCHTGNSEPDYVLS